MVNWLTNFGIVSPFFQRRAGGAVFNRPRTDAGDPASRRRCGGARAQGVTAEGLGRTSRGGSALPLTEPSGDEPVLGRNQGYRN